MCFIFLAFITTCSFASPFNDGVHFYQNKEFGKAYAYFQKAAFNNPFDLESKKGAHLAFQQLLLERGEAFIDPASNAIETLSDAIVFYSPELVCGLIFLLAALFFYFSLKRKNLILRYFSFFLAILALFASLSPTMSKNRPPAYCIQEEVIHGGPGYQLIELEKIYPGTKVRISELGKEWTKIYFSRNSAGWVPTTSLLLLFDQ